MPFEIGQVLVLAKALRNDVPAGTYIMMSPSGGSMVYLCQAEKGEDGGLRKTENIVEISGQELWAFEQGQGELIE